MAQHEHGIWSEEEIQYLRDNVNRNTKLVAAEMERSYTSVIKARQRFGINRLTISESLEDEEWKIVEEYPILEVSNFGRLRNSTRKNILKPRIDKNGYYSINIKIDNGKGKNLTIHRLVAIAFIKRIRLKRQVNHKDGCKTNNHVSNLEWVTSSENMRHAYDSGLMPITRSRSKKK